MEQNERNIPFTLKSHNWEMLLRLESVSARKKYYAHLRRSEIFKLSNKRKKEENAIERKQALAARKETNSHIEYGLGHNAIFHKIYDSTIRLWHHHKLIQAMKFEPKYVQEVLTFPFHPRSFFTE